MKRTLCILALALTGVAHAEVTAQNWNQVLNNGEASNVMRYQQAQVQRAEQSQQDHCFLLGQAYLQAAGTRDVHLSPQDALPIISSIIGDEHSARVIINNVYFDPSYEEAGGQALGDQVESLCLRAHWKKL